MLFIVHISLQTIHSDYTCAYTSRRSLHVRPEHATLTLRLGLIQLEGQEGVAKWEGTLWEGQPAETAPGPVRRWPRSAKTESSAKNEVDALSHASSGSTLIICDICAFLRPFVRRSCFDKTDALEPLGAQVFSSEYSNRQNQKNCGLINRYS